MPYELPSDAPVTFPTQDRLEYGLLLSIIAHAISTLPSERVHDEYHWRGSVLEILDYNETSGCICWNHDLVVGAFFCCESEHSPFGEDPVPPYDAEEFFAAAPPDVRVIAREKLLLEFVSWVGDPVEIDTAFINGTTDQLDDTYFVPVITAAFWSVGDVLTSGKPWTDVYRNGAYLLRHEFLEAEQALAEWENGMQLLPDQVALARQLYERRLHCEALPMRLTETEYAQLIAHGVAQLEPVRELLHGIAIELP